MQGPFILSIDPIIGQIGGLYIWWYGLSYSLGFLGVFLWFRRTRKSLEMDMGEVYSLSILLAFGVLVGGRLVEVIFYEWSYYGSHLRYIPAVWLGGMSTHGILLGAVIGVWLFCKRYGKSFIEVADHLAVPGAYIMGIGRLGNFIDGQIVGSVTDVWWAVKFPDVEGFRHPVVLYDGLKNLLLIPFLLLVQKFHPPRGVVVGHFILWYGFFRIFVDFFREYRTDFLGFPPGQEFNIFMSLAGLGLIIWAYRKRRGRVEDKMPPDVSGSLPSQTLNGSWTKRGAFAVLLIFPLVIPSDWTQDIPLRYGKRHDGLDYSVFYPRIQVTKKVD